MSLSGRVSIVASVCLAAVLGAPACDDAPVEALAVRKVFPEEGRELLLNQEIVVTFDRALDPLSVTRDSIRLVDGQRRVLELERVRVRESTIEFVPRAPIQADLGDGSFRSGAEITLELAAYPAPGALRSQSGHLVEQPLRRTWRVVDAQAMHAEGRMSFLPSLETGPFRLESLPRVSADGLEVELVFDRPLYPPSMSPLAVLVSDGALPIACTMRPAGRGQARGRVLVLALDRPVPRTGAVLSFRSGHHGLLDYRLQPLLVPQDPTLVARPSHASLRIQRQGGRADVDGLEEPFERARRPPPNVDELGLGFEVDGSLRWERGGLRMPSLDWPAFRSVGVFDPPAPTTIVRPGAEVEIGPGDVQRLPEGRLDLDRFVVGERQRVVLVLPSSGVLRVRVAGRMLVEGDLILRLPSSATTARPTGEVGAIDPRVAWNEVDGYVEFDVAGRVVVTGSIRSDGASPGTSAGVLIARDQLSVAGAIDVQAWRAPREARGPQASSVELPGRFVAVSPWYDVSHVASWEGRSIASGARQGLEVYVQTRRMLPGARTGPWTFVEVLRDQGQLEALRFAVAARGHADGSFVLERLSIR